MAVLVILENKGDPEKLLPAADELTRRCGRVEGLLFSAMAETDGGTVLIHLWESQEVRQRFHENQALNDAYAAVGWESLVEEQVGKDYVTNRVQIFGPIQDYMRRAV
jgi:hypothetical protein